MTSQTKHILRELGLRATGSVVDVLDVFLQSEDECFSHAQLHDHLGAAGHEINRVTLYRTLERLEEARLIHRFVDEQRVSRYGAVKRGCAGNRFICTCCHRQTIMPRTEDAQKKLMRKIEQECAASGRRSAQVQLAVYGTCEKCVTA